MWFTRKTKKTNVLRDSICVCTTNNTPDLITHFNFEYFNRYQIKMISLTENKNGQNGLLLDNCDAVNKPVIPTYCTNYYIIILNYNN